MKKFFIQAAQHHILFLPFIDARHTILKYDYYYVTMQNYVNKVCVGRIQVLRKSYRALFNLSPTTHHYYAN